MLLSALALCSASSDPTEALAGVHDLNADNFDKVVNGAKFALVEFYAPWCGHCKHLTPEYKKLGELVQNDPKLKHRVVIAKVDADAHRPVGERFEVRGFPTIKFFARGKPVTKEGAVDYNQARTAEAMLQYIKQQLDADKGFARVEALDAITKGFAEATDKKAVVDKVTAKVADLEGDDKVNGQVYIKMMENAIKKGVEYLSKEKARVDRILQGSVSSSKVEELARKSSVLGALLGTDDE